VKHLYDNLDLFEIEELNSSSFRFESENELKNLVILESQDYEKNLEFLKKVLPAIGFDPTAYLIIDKSKASYFPLSGIIKSNVKELLVFGQEPSILGLPKHLGKHKAYMLEPYRISFTHTLEEMIADANLKKFFWGFAKKTFLSNT